MNLKLKKIYQHIKHFNNILYSYLQQVVPSCQLTKHRYQCFSQFIQHYQPPDVGNQDPPIPRKTVRFPPISVDFIQHKI